MDDGVIHSVRGRKLAVGVTEGNEAGAPNVVTVGDPVAYEAIRSGRTRLAPGEVLGLPPEFDKRGILLPESHVECLGARTAASEYGATGGRIGTVPKRCHECARLMAGSRWTHTNPK